MNMNIHLMKGFWRYMINVPPSLWKKEVAKHERKVKAKLAFMSNDHRRVHHWVVKELPTAGKPLSPKTISEKLDLPGNRVAVVLDDLEKNMTFLFRNADGHVIWAYPVTVEKTPHHLTFSSGEQIYAA
jgi:hypothetical protein